MAGGKDGQVQSKEQCPDPGEELVSFRRGEDGDSSMAAWGLPASPGVKH